MLFDSMARARRSAQDACFDSTARARRSAQDAFRLIGAGTAPLRMLSSTSGDYRRFLLRMI
jgi:hypothetical protein